MERLEDGLKLVFGDPWATIEHRDPDVTVTRLLIVDFDFSGEFERIVDQIGEDAAERMRSRHRVGFDAATAITAFPMSW